MRTIRLLIQALIVCMPWSLRKLILQYFFSFQFGKDTYIGPFSWIFPKRLVMQDHARIGSLNVAIHLNSIEMAEHATIGRGNWITGHSHSDKRHYAHRYDRNSSLKIGQHSAITKSHLLDCTDRITIGSFTTIAGYGSQFITHGIDIIASRQDCKPIEIGNYCFVGSCVIVLGGARLPSRCILGAGSTLTKPFDEREKLYAGVPARVVKKLPGAARYFNRTQGFVW